MKIGYLLRWDESPESGVFKKVLTQIECWLDCGHEVKIFFLIKKDLEMEKFLKRNKILNIKYETAIYTSVWSRIWREKKLLSSITKWADLIYFRYGIYFPFTWRALKYKPSVVEINSNIKSELKILKISKVKYYYALINNHFLYKNVKGFIFVSHELSQKAEFKRFRNRLVVANGIDLDKYKQLPLINCGQVNLLFLGSPSQPWHGVDKILFLAKTFSNWYFNIVGPNTSQYTDIPGNMHYHGYLPYEKYKLIAEKCCVAIGSLAMHRVGMNESSSLKIKEYLAMGLPVILSAPDVDFLDKNYSFILRLANIEENVVVALKEIAQFIDFWKDKRIYRSEIEHIAAKLKEEKRLQFFSNILRLDKRYNA